MRIVPLDGHRRVAQELSRSIRTEDTAPVDNPDTAPGLFLREAAVHKCHAQVIGYANGRSTRPAKDNPLVLQASARCFDRR